MRTLASRFELLALAWLVAAPACLPAGEPPAGQQIWAGRDGVLMAVLAARSPDDGVVRALTFRPGQGFGTDVSVISVAPSGVVTDQPLVERWTCIIWPCTHVDHRGRLFAWSAPEEAQLDLPPAPTLSRVDLDSGERIDFGVVSTYAFSPSRRRVALSLAATIDSSNVVVMLEEDDSSPTELSPALYPAFVGEDLYFVGEGRVLWRLPADRPREVAREGVEFFATVSTTDGPRLLVRLPPTDVSAPGPVLLLNPTTGDERRLPPIRGRLPSVSPDGQWALLHDFDEASRRKFTLVDLSTGTEEPFDLPVDTNEPQWRPNHTELWFQASAYPDRSTFIKQPHQQLRQLPEAIRATGLGASVAASGFASSVSFFTRDGRHLFSTETTNGDQDPQFFVGDADDPAGQRFPLNPPGTRFSQYHELPDGRLVVEAFYRGPDRSDIYLVNPDDGAMRLLGKDGTTLARGANRVVALTHRVDRLGDLEAIDLATGHATPLAREFVTFAHVQPRPDDPAEVSPAAPVVFQFRARFASPYDGFWLTTLP